MTLIGLDDTDSRERGMCTTYAAAILARRLPAVERTLLVRLNPAVEHKTRGNAALAVHTSAGPEAVRPHVAAVLDMAETDDPRTNPGAVIVDRAPGDVPAPFAAFADDALHEILSIEDARALIADAGVDSIARGNGRGLVGALAAVGAWRAHDDWTYERIAYREADRWGTERAVDDDSVFAAAEADYPAVWDTVDRVEDYAVCVPRTPCPILHGVRGDDPDAVERVSAAIDGEPVAVAHTFLTNQGTDAHLRPASVADLAATPAADGGATAVDGPDDSDPNDAAPDGGAYRVTGDVVTAPETREGGHVFLAIGEDGHRLECAAFEPTKRFREHVRALRVDDRITACGELSEGTLKLEKFAVRDLVRAERVVPACPDCERSMESAGRDQGYRCRDCATSVPGKRESSLDRAIEVGWYEVPPVARRHVAKPLVRGGFDAPVHPER